MPKILYVTMGQFSNRFMSLDDDTATAALADGWALDTTAEGFDPFNIVVPEQVPQSLTDWETAINTPPPDGAPQEPPPVTEPEEPPPPPEEETPPSPPPPPPPPVEEPPPAEPPAEGGTP